jgi:transcriptional antiterminator NusG
LLGREKSRTVTEKEDKVNVEAPEQGETPAEAEVAETEATAEVTTAAAETEATAEVTTEAAETGATAEVTTEAAETEATAEVATEAAETEATVEVTTEAVGSVESADAETVAAPETSEPTEPAEPAGEEEESRKKWYVIHTYSGHENKVRANLERVIQYAKMQELFGEVLVATEDYVVMKGGKKHITKRKTFPSYVLVEMEMNDETRALVTGIPGVTHFVGDKSAAPLSATEVRRIRGEEVKEKGQVTTEVPFKVGESVRVTNGPFADFVGTVDEINLERGKLRVMVSIFGRPTAVELDIMHVTNI